MNKKGEKATLTSC